MLMNIYQALHDSFGLCFWDLPALVVGIIMIVVFAVHKENHRTREKDFEEELKEKVKRIKYGIREIE